MCEPPALARVSSLRSPGLLASTLGVPTTPGGARTRGDCRPLVGAGHRWLLRKVLDRERFVFYPKAEGEERWYEVGVTPTLDRFFGALPMLKEAVASLTGGLATYYELPLVGETRQVA